MNRTVDRVRSALLKLLFRQGALRPSTAVEKIIKADPALSRLAVQEGLRELASELVGVTGDGRVVGMLRWRDPPVKSVPEELQLWRKQVGAVDRHDPLWDPPSTVWELNEVDRSVLAEQLRQPLSAPKGADQYIVSAVNLLGSSKLLDSLGLSEKHGPDALRPLFVITAGPSNPKSVLIVENASTFSALALSEFCREHLCVCAFGYGLSIEKLGERLTSGTTFACPAVGDRVDLPSIIPAKEVYFWGDLDIEGLRIFESLWSAFPHVQLAAIYREMEKRVADRRASHPYHRLFGSGKPRQRPPRGALPETRHLARQCSERAVDQEALWPINDWSLLSSPYRLSEVEISVESA